MIRFLFWKACSYHKMRNGLDNGQCECRSFCLEAQTLVQRRKDQCLNRVECQWK